MRVQEWARYAVCREFPVELFFPEGQGHGSHDAKKIKALCMSCPVRRQCLSAALYAERSTPSRRYGIFGGMTAEERKKFWAGLLEKRTVRRCSKDLHVLDEANTFMDRGNQACRACRRESQDAYDRRQSG